MSDWIVSFVGRLGNAGVFLLMFLENVFPPIPSELIMPLAGFHAKTGQMNLWAVIVAGSLGSLAGTSIWYILGRSIGEQRLRHWIERHGVWLTVSIEDLDRSKAWFHRRGGMAVFLCRLVPGLRSVISLPAGFTGMGAAPFLLYSSVGTVVWTAALAYAGYLLGGAYEQVSSYLGHVSLAFIAATVLTYIWRVARQLRRRKQPS